MDRFRYNTLKLYTDIYIYIYNIYIYICIYIYTMCCRDKCQQELVLVIK